MMLLDLTVFMILALVLTVTDIRSMVKSKLKKEIIPYVLMTAAAVVLGLIYFINPIGYSISHMIIHLFNIN